MDLILYENLHFLKKALENDPRILKLNELEKELSNNIDAMKLSYQKDLKETNYIDALKHFKTDSNEVKNAQKELYEAKYQLDNLEIVKQYNKAYQEVRLLYEEINKLLFSDFKEKMCSQDDQD